MAFKCIKGGAIDVAGKVPRWWGWLSEGEDKGH